MFPIILCTLAVIIVGAIGLLLAAGPLKRQFAEREATQGMSRFRVQREQLEARFFDLAASLGKPRGLRWVDCDWQNGVNFARDVNTGMLTAFVGVNIRFEAIEGGDMEDVAAVSTIRDAAAVFHYQNGRWGTGGRALFNMNPEEAISRLVGQYEPVTAETEKRTATSHS